MLLKTAGLLQKTFDGESTLIQVMAWCHQATSYDLSQCYDPRSRSPFGITRPQWFKTIRFCFEVITLWGHMKDVVLVIVAYILPGSLGPWLRRLKYVHLNQLISNYVHCKVWDEITYPCRNVNGATVQVILSTFTEHVITYPCQD